MNAFLFPCLFLALFLSASFASPILSSSQVVFKLDSLSSHNTSHSLAVSPSLYDDFVQYSKYSSIAYKYSSHLPTYKWRCPRPLGNTLIRYVDGGWTHGFIARDDKRKEIVVSFPGTSSWKDIITDARATLIPFKLPGIIDHQEMLVHTGFLSAYKDVAHDVIATVTKELDRFPGHRIVVTGHSLGGAIASIAALSLKIAIPRAALKLYTFGQPRVGTKKFARHVEDTIGVDNIFRAVHKLDSVPMVPRIDYEHLLSHPPPVRPAQKRAEMRCGWGRGHRLPGWSRIYALHKPVPSILFWAE
ncbi:Alpha/Beta hydrolase protein [Mycena leptocephala]|nr:Alpha/Beta hydrolase protein [Mycena leptocephala]